MGRGARAAWEAVRAVVPVLDEDRPLGPDVEQLRSLVVDGTLLRAVANRP
jgi:histidine ammonia-lyase